MLISQSIGLWDDPRLIYAVAIIAVILLAITIWLFRRTKRDGRAAGAICLIISIGLHAALIYLVPYQAEKHGGSTTVNSDPDAPGVESLHFSTFHAEFELDTASAETPAPAIAPLPVAELNDLLADPIVESVNKLEIAPDTPTRSPEVVDESPPLMSPPSLSKEKTTESNNVLEQIANSLDSSLDQLLQSQLEVPENADSIEAPAADVSVASSQLSADATGSHSKRSTATSNSHETAAVPGAEEADFANRIGAAKQRALMETGGNAQTEAAVSAALRFLAAAQRADGAWDPTASGAGVERMPLGENRFGAGTKCATALTGLSLLAMMGSGHTHIEGEYSENVFRGLAYLIRNQHPDGSLSGNATIYAASYCHSMAALSVCEAAVMTQDKSAIESSRRAIAHTARMQHPVTGGWRYTRGDPGDLSQLGWQAMVLDAGKRAGIKIPNENVAGVARFLRSVRAGRGGLACYRPGEATSRTMTAEALATRLLIGERVPKQEIAEAERYLMEALPGTRQDNYYCWYYATLALHQQQDAAWERWNAALINRLLATQRPDGSWPSSTMWGGYGGTVYTTAMATLCLETYYRHAIRDSNARIATRP